MTKKMICELEVAGIKEIANFRRQTKTQVRKATLTEQTYGKQWSNASWFVNRATFKAYVFYGLLQLVQHLFTGFERSDKNAE